MPEPMRPVEIIRKDLQAEGMQEVAFIHLAIEKVFDSVWITPDRDMIAVAFRDGTYTAFELPKITSNA